MNHFTTPQFWQLYKALPAEVRTLADKSFLLLKTDPKHSSLRFKKAGQYWSVRVGLHYRALAYDRPEGALWFWIGPHGTYDGYLP